ncbi:MAG: ABC transporter permease [Armatimonadetes bacterium]|nr:ABC transporter permease [Armatimonadota bacterium]
MRQALTVFRGVARSLVDNGLRSVLTVLGVAIGVGSAVLLVALARGVEKDIDNELQRLGADLVTIISGKLAPGGMPNFMSLAALSTLRESDVEVIRRVPGVARACPMMLTAGSVEYGKDSASSLVVASEPIIFKLRPTELAEGRIWSDAEADQPVCVLADTPRHVIFGKGPALGGSVTIRGKRFRVVGTLAPEPESSLSLGVFSFSNVVYIPFRTAKAYYPEGQVNRIFLKTNYRKAPAAVLEQVRREVRANHGGHDDFSVLTQETLLGAMFRVFGIITALLSGISAVSLVVAGVGVMNIMLVTVTERTREIGIRKAVGATRADIFRQFLAEAVCICILGGAAGLALAQGVCATVSSLTPLKPVITSVAVCTALTVCTAVGIIFGVAPALRAAAKDPVEAIRWE